MYARISLAMLLALAAGCGPAPQTVQDAGPLVIGCDTNFMPFEFKENGEFKGFDIDLWKAVAEELGREYRFQAIDFSGLIPALQTGGIDAALAGMTITSEREKVVDFAYPYRSAPEASLARFCSQRCRAATARGKRKHP